MTDQPAEAERPIVYAEEPVAPPPVTDEAVEEQLAAKAKPATEATAGGVPGWFLVPEGYAFPRRRLVFIRFPSAWTDRPGIGKPLPVEDAQSLRVAPAGALWRQCLCVPLSVGDGKHAYARSMGDGNRLAEELTKQMVRVVDGRISDWSGDLSEGNIDVWWDQIGGPCRTLLNRMWSQLHSLTRERERAFFESCIVVRAGG